MAQFDIYRRVEDGIAFLLDLQDDMLEVLSTRVVAPMVPVGAVGPAMRDLNPRIAVAGAEYVLLTHLLAAIPAAVLGKPVGSVAAQREEIIRAVDFLFTGI